MVLWLSRQVSSRTTPSSTRLVFCDFCLTCQQLVCIVIFKLDLNSRALFVSGSETTVPIKGTEFVTVIRKIWTLFLTSSLSNGSGQKFQDIPNSYSAEWWAPVDPVTISEKNQTSINSVESLLPVDNCPFLFGNLTVSDAKKPARRECHTLNLLKRRPKQIRVSTNYKKWIRTRMEIDLPYWKYFNFRFQKLWWYEKHMSRHIRVQWN